MNVSVLKVVVVFFTLLFSGFLITGCAEKHKVGWVNTNSLPGQTFKEISTPSLNVSSIVYLGSNDGSTNVNFGPKDISFEFKDLHQ